MLLQHINKILKVIGLNLVHAKRAKGTVTGRKSKTVYIAGPCGPTGAAGKDCRTYPERSAFTTADDGQTHYVGDDCPGGHVDASPTQDNNISGPAS